MKSPASSGEHNRAKVPVPAPRRGVSRPRRRLGRWLLVTTMVAAIAMATWASVVFDPLGTATRAYGRGEFAAALKAAEAHLRRWPGDRAASLMAARCATRFGQLLRAEEHFRQARPTGRDDLRNRAYGLVLLRAPNRASEVYAELIVRYPDDARGLKGLAAILMDQKLFAEAGQLGERLIRIPGEEVPGRTLVGIAHHVLKKYQQAGDQFEKIARLDPSLGAMPLPRTLFWNHLAIDLMAQGRDSEARAYLLKAIDRDQDAGLVEMLGLTYHRQGATVEAERCWRKALELDPRNAKAWLDLGRVALADRPAESIPLLEKAAELSPGSVEVQHNLGLAYRLVGNKAASGRCVRRVAQLRAQHPRPGETLASPDGDRAGLGPIREVGS